jgi:putative metallohydrolase (TIGR04338 family)
MRDSQRGKLYAAEQSTPAWQRSKHVSRMSSTLEVWVYLERIQRDSWFQRHFGRWTFQLGDGRGRRRGVAYANKYMKTGTIKLPRFARHPMYILHEVAHCVNESGEAAHGRTYCRLYLLLVRHFMGRDAERELRAAYRTHRVKHRPKRILSEAQRAALVQRATAMRAAAGP